MPYRIVNGKLRRVELEVISDCSNCGACCMHRGTPPGYSAYYQWKGEIAAWAKESPDYERWQNLPPEVEAELRAYFEGVRDGKLADRSAGFKDLDAAWEAIQSGQIKLAAQEIAAVAKKSRGLEVPCLWFDLETKRCKHYEHRPETCRDAIHPGDDACRATRKHFGVGQ